jgi:hypothetical protein
MRIELSIVLLVVSVTILFILVMLFAPDNLPLDYQYVFDDRWLQVCVDSSDSFDCLRE